MTQPSSDKLVTDAMKPLPVGRQFIDEDALTRWRTGEGSGHDLSANNNTVRRLVATIDYYRTREAARPLADGDMVERTIRDLAGKLYHHHTTKYDLQAEERCILEAIAAIRAHKEEAERERDEAQSTVQAWVHVAEGLEAHIMDRAAMNGPANPETYLSILRGDVADVAKRSEQICAARWADYKRHSNTIEALQARLDAVRQLIEQGYRGVNKTDQCEHGKYGFEDCIACYDEALTKALNGERM